MTFIRPCLVVLFLAVLMLQMVVPVSASTPTFDYKVGGVTQTEADKEGAGHPNGGNYVFWSDAIPEGEFYGVFDSGGDGTTDGLNPLGPGIRLIVIFRGGKYDGTTCWTQAHINGTGSTTHCAAE